MGIFGMILSITQEIFIPFDGGYEIKKKKVHSIFKDSISGANLADMQLTSKFSKGFRFLLFVIVIYSK